MPCRNRLFVPLALFGVLLLALSLVGSPSVAQAGHAPVKSAAVPGVSREDLLKADLERQKLAQEVLQLKNANASHVAGWDRLASILPFVTALLAAAGFWTAYGKDRRAERAQRQQEHDLRDKELEQREQERRQREAESHRWLAEQQAERRRNLDANFGAALASLRGQDDEGKAAAVVSLLSFLKPEPEYAAFHAQVFLILQAMLKLLYPASDQDTGRSEVKGLFVRALEQTLAVLPLESPLRRDMDLARMYLSRADLSGQSLRHADLGYCVMPSVNLSGADLFRVRGIGVGWEGANLSGTALGEARLKYASCRRANFHGAWLVAAVLKGADLREADFRGASLQSAHFEKANLIGARFEGADVNDTYFVGASFDRVALQSLVLARNWRNNLATHFSPDIVPQLEQAGAVADLKRAQAEQKKAQKK